MTAGSNPARAKDLFLDALERPAAEREAFVERACADDPSLRSRVLELLRAHDSSERVLGGATPGLARIVDLSPGDAVGPYRLVRRLGEGGFGIVYEAEQAEPVRRRVALKVVKLGMDTRAVIARFEAERQALALMDHPSIARVFDAGATESGRPYFAMELVRGAPVTQFCEEHRLSKRERLALFRTACLAVQHAHQKGVIHRDLKPSNILVADVDGQPVPKVIDFGIAKATGERLTENSFLSQDGQVVGTPSYMSPEQAAGGADVDTRSDVYSLGVVLYELLCGAPPFDVGQLGFVELVRRIREVDPTLPSVRARAAAPHDETSVRHVDPDLDWIVLRALEKDPARRYPTAFALAADVERFLDDRPIEAAPPELSYRVSRFVRRHRLATAAAAAVAASLLLAVGGVSTGLVRSQRANAALARVNDELADSLRREREEGERARRAEAQAASEAAEARRQADIAGAVNAFLNDDLLGAVAPSLEPGRGREVSMREVLDAAARDLERAGAQGGRFAGAPLVEAAVRYTLGSTYVSLGEYGAAEPHLARCVELRAAELGPEHRETLVAESLRTSALRRTGRVEESERVLERVVDAQRRTLGRTDPQTLFSVVRLARTLWDAGRADEAIALYEESLAEALPVLGDEEEAVLWTMEGLASGYLERGEFDRAEELFRRVLEVRRRVEGDESDGTVGALTNLARAYTRRFRRDEAVPILREALGVQERLLGVGHPATISTQIALAFALFGTGEIDEAEQILVSALPVARAKLGEHNLETLSILTDLARVRQARNDLATAEAMMREALAGYEVVGEPAEKDARKLKKSLGLLLSQQRRTDEARELLYETYAQERELLDPGHPDLMLSRLYLSAVYKEQGLADETEAVLREGLGASLERYGPEEAWSVTFAYRLADLLNRQRRYAEAEEIARDALAWSETTVGPRSVERATCLLQLGTALARQGKLEEARAPLEQAFEIASADSLQLVTQVYAAHELAVVYRAQGRDGEAADLEALVARYGSGDPLEPVGR